MNNIINQDIQGINIFDIIAKPDNYPEEVQNAAYEVLVKRMFPQLREWKQKLEQNLIKYMNKEKADIAHFVDISGEMRTAVLKKGKMECKEDNPDKIFEKAGFDSTEIGEYVFKPSWAKAKKAMKVGGEKREVIEKMFREGKQTIEIK